MATTTTDTWQPAKPDVADSDNYLTHTRGLASWVFTLDHKRVGIMFLVSVTLCLGLGAFFALLIRTELAHPGPTIMTETTARMLATATMSDQTLTPQQMYNRVFTLHGAIMIFLVVIPAIPSALGNFILPLQLGAKDVAFPRLNLFSYHLFFIGAVFFILTLLLGGVDTGWTFYAPYSVESSTAVTTAVIGAFVLGFGSIFTGLNFLVTVHTLRPREMTWFKMPLMVWALYSTAIIQLLATPVLAITLVLLFAERLFGVGIFDPALEGDPVLFQHFFWFYSHPAVYIMILPAMGIISEVISVHSHKHIFGYKFIAYSSVAIALLGFLVWGHHMFVSGQSPLAGVIFSALTFSVAIPSAIKVFNWVATMYKGSIAFTTPMLYAMIFIILFGLGGLTGLFLGALATDVHVHDTSFVVAHFHYQMVGGGIIAFICGVHHWWPKMTGRMYSEKIGRIVAIAILVGFNMTYFPQFIIGSRGMPRRYFDYESMLTEIPGLTFYQMISTIGGFIFVGGLVAIPIYLIYSLKKGPVAPANPWGGATLEWQTSSPPPWDNFKKTPVATDPYDFDDLQFDEKTQGYVKAL